MLKGYKILWDDRIIQADNMILTIHNIYQQIIKDWYLLDAHCRKLQKYRKTLFLPYRWYLFLVQDAPEIHERIHIFLASLKMKILTVNSLKKSKILRNF
jgi:hypothetical protein